MTKTMKTTSLSQGDGEQNIFLGSNYVTVHTEQTFVHLSLHVHVVANMVTVFHHGSFLIFIFCENRWFSNYSLDLRLTTIFINDRREPPSHIYIYIGRDISIYKYTESERERGM